MFDYCPPIPTSTPADDPCQYFTCGDDCVQKVFLYPNYLFQQGSYNRLALLGKGAYLPAVTVCQLGIIATKLGINNNATYIGI